MVSYGVPQYSGMVGTTTMAAAPAYTTMAAAPAYTTMATPMATTTMAAAPAYTTMAAAPAYTTMAAPMATTIAAAPAYTTMAAAPAYTTMAAPMANTIAAAYQPPQIFNQSPYQYQFLPTVSSVGVPAQVASVTPVAAPSSVGMPTQVASVTPVAAPKATGGALRVTICPIKEGSEKALTKFLNGKEVADGMAGLSGVKSGEAFFEDNKLIVIARYDNMENLEIGSAVNAKLLGQAAENLAGAPNRYSGQAAWSYKGRGSSTDEVAIRVTTLPIKPGSEAAILELTNSIEKNLDDRALDECIDIVTFFTEGQMVAVARYSNMKGLEAASEVVKETMGTIAQFAVGAPNRFCGSSVWTTATKKKTKAKKGCC